MHHMSLLKSFTLVIIVMKPAEGHVTLVVDGLKVL